MRERRLVAQQLSLLGEAPRNGYGWRPTLYQWVFAGIPVPPSDDERRQAAMMRADTFAPAAPSPERAPEEGAE